MTLLANASLETSEAAVGRSLGQALACADTLSSGNWQLFDVVRELGDHRRDASLLIMSRLAETLISDEHVVPMKPRLEELTRDAMQLLAASQPSSGPLTPPVTAPTLPNGGAAPIPVELPPAPPATWSEVIDEKQQLQLSGTDAVTALDELKTLVTSERDLELTLSWRVQRKGTNL